MVRLRRLRMARTCPRLAPLPNIFMMLFLPCKQWLEFRLVCTLQIGHSMDVSKIGTFAKYLREVFRADNDAATLRLAAETLGRLVAAGGALTADVVEQEVRQCCSLCSDAGYWYPALAQ